MRILLSNDDGLHACGLRQLYHALKERGHEVFAVAPASEQSAKSSALTTRKPLFADPVKDGNFEGYAVHGTPADSVLLGLGALHADVDFDLVMSGINHGPNVSVDVFYSGTVGAALQGALDGLPAMAVSSAYFEGDGMAQAAHAADLAGRIAWKALPLGVVCNVNYPDCPLEECRGLMLCRHGVHRPCTVGFEQRIDPRGKPYWWTENYLHQVMMDDPGTDKGYLLRKYITLTPLRYDLTDQASLAVLEEVQESL